MKKAILVICTIAMLGTMVSCSKEEASSKSSSEGKTTSSSVADSSDKDSSSKDSSNAESSDLLNDYLSQVGAYEIGLPKKWATRGDYPLCAYDKDKNSTFYITDCLTNKADECKDLSGVFDICKEEIISGISKLGNGLTPTKFYEDDITLDVTKSENVKFDNYEFVKVTGTASESSTNGKCSFIGYLTLLKDMEDGKEVTIPLYCLGFYTEESDAKTMAELIEASAKTIVAID